tara:strand:+ start:190 stop:618 length:429 start_codon:yes stop_codon:yes gene_type:complete
MKKEKFLQEVNRLKGNTNLKSQRIDLGLNQDLTARADEVSLLAQDAEDLMSTAESSIIESEKITADLRAYQGNLTDLQALLSSKINELYDLVGKVEASAEELGVSVSNIDGYENAVRNDLVFGEDTDSKIDDTLSAIYDALP